MAHGVYYIIYTKQITNNSPIPDSSPSYMYVMRAEVVKGWHEPVTIQECPRGNAAYSKEEKNINLQ